MKMTERLTILEKHKPDTAVARIRAMSDEELDAAIRKFKPEEIEQAERELKQWLN